MLKIVLNLVFFFSSVKRNWICQLDLDDYVKVIVSFLHCCFCRVIVSYFRFRKKIQLHAQADQQNVGNNQTQCRRNPDKKANESLKVLDAKYDRISHAETRQPGQMNKFPNLWCNNYVHIAHNPSMAQIEKEKDCILQNHIYP